MRHRVLALLLLLALLPSPASAQSDGTVLSDVEGDLRLAAQGQTAPLPAGLEPEVDLVALRIEEDPALFRFILQVADVPQSSEPSDGAIWTVEFQHGGRRFMLEAGHIFPFVTGLTLTAFHYRDDDAAPWSTLWFGSDRTLIDPSSDTLTTEIDRRDLRDASGTEPFPGRSLAEVHVRSMAASSVIGLQIDDVAVRPPADVVDAMPDDGQPLGAWPVQWGLVQSGHARLVSDQPFRSSNGEATTFLLKATARNLGDATDRFDLRVQPGPGAAHVLVPIPSVEIPAGGEQEVVAILAVPFAHRHGDDIAFILELASQNDAGSVGRIEMGVHFLTIPQPAGHHNQLFFHSRGSPGTLDLFHFGELYMNTLEEVDGDAKLGGEPSWSSVSLVPPESEMIFDVPLDPLLQLGLDFDVARAGTFAVPIAAPAPAPMAGVRVELVTVDSRHPFDEEGMVVLADGQAEPADMLVPNEVHLFEGVLQAKPEADMVPYEPFRNLVFRVHYTTLLPFVFGGQQPTIQPGGHLELPLNEYRDPVDDALRFLGGPVLTTPAQEQLVNPGKRVAFAVDVENTRDDADTFDFTMLGRSAAWAQVAPQTLTLDGHATGRVTVLVTAPAATPDGERADLVLQAIGRERPDATGLLRLVAEADTDAEHGDAAGFAAGKDSPLWPLAALAALVLALAQMRRRRDHRR